MKQLLPIGSVVLLKDSDKRVMVTGRYQHEAGDESAIWDYCGCLYPEGNMGPEYNYLFNNDQVERLYFVGFQDEEEFDFLARLASEAPEFMGAAD